MGGGERTYGTYGVWGTGKGESIQNVNKEYRNILKSENKKFK